MAAAVELSDERASLIYRHYEQLYRMALLVAGESGATDGLVECAFAALSPTDNSEAALVRALLAALSGGAARQGWRYAAQAADFTRAGIDPARGSALLQVFASLTSRDRLIVGLHYLRGLSSADIDHLLEAAPADRGGSVRRRSSTAPGAADVLAQVRIALARALDLLPSLVGAEVLLALDRYAAGVLPAPATAQLRARMHSYPELRDARDGLLEGHHLLMRAIPALFAIAPPADLLERLLEGPPTRERRSRLPRLTWAHAGLIGLVAVLIAALLVAPALVRPGAAPEAPDTGTAAELIDAAIRRFDQPQLQTGILHEVYRVAWSDQPPYTIERWYEYAAPHRMRVELRADDGSPPLLAIASDGHGLVQFRTTSSTYYGNQLNDSLDIHVSPAELAAALPILRELPSPGVYSSGPFDGADISRFFLASARAGKAAIMGTTTFRGRTGYILAYHTDQPLPPPLAIYFRRQPPPSPNRVLLTIDSQTYGVLDVAVLPAGDRVAAIRHPWQMQSLVVAAEVDDAVFQLPAAATIAQREGLPSPRGYSAPREQVLSPSAIAALLRRPLLVPQALPDPTMRGVILTRGRDPTDPADLRLLYDGAFVSMALLPSPLTSPPVPPSPEEQTAGAFRYQLLSSGVQNSDLVVASVYPIAAPHQQMLLMLMDSYATPQEREATVRRVISSLVPLTPVNAKALERQFYRPSADE